MNKRSEKLFCTEINTLIGNSLIRYRIRLVFTRLHSDEIERDVQLSFKTAAPENLPPKHSLNSPKRKVCLYPLVSILRRDPFAGVFIRGLTEHNTSHFQVVLIHTQISVKLGTMTHR